MSFIVEGDFSSPASLTEGEGVRGREEDSASAAKEVRSEVLSDFGSRSMSCTSLG